MTDFFSKHFGLAGKRALVTGAGRGIGKAVAQGLAAAGAHVAVHYHASHDDALHTVEEIAQAGGKAFALQADLTDSRQTNSLFEQLRADWPTLDILVNNSGDLVRRCRIEDMDDELIDQVIRVNLHTTLYATRAAIPMLRGAAAPVIVNVSSVAAHNGGANGATLYAATKGALLTMTRGLAKELAPHIRVNAIAPGVANTDFHRVHSTPEGLRTIAHNTPLQRLGEPRDHVAAVVFLCAPGAAFITGEMIEINGGLWLA